MSSSGTEGEGVRRIAVGSGMVMASLAIGLSGCSDSSTSAPSVSPSDSSVADASWCGQVDQIANSEAPSVESMQNLQSAMGPNIPKNVHASLENGITNATITPDDWATIQTYIEQECPSYPSAS